MKCARAVLVVQDDVQQGTVHLDVAVVANESEFAKAIHEEADAGSRGTNHLSQGFLTNLWNGGCRACQALPNCASSRRIRARRFSLELKS